MLVKKEHQDPKPSLLCITLNIAEAEENSDAVKRLTEIASETREIPFGTCYVIPITEANYRWCFLVADMGEEQEIRYFNCLELIRQGKTLVLEDEPAVEFIRLLWGTSTPSLKRRLTLDNYRRAKREWPRPFFVKFSPGYPFSYFEILGFSWNGLLIGEGGMAVDGIKKKIREALGKDVKFQFAPKLKQSRK